MGIGSDIGGSIRAPAAFNGVYGLRASGWRVCDIGVDGDGTWMRALKEIKVSYGPLSRSVDDLVMYYKLHFGNCWKRHP